MKRRNSSHSGRFKDLAVVIGGIDIAATRAFKKPSIRISCDLSARSGILLKNLHRTNKMHGPILEAGELRKTTRTSQLRLFAASGTVGFVWHRSR
jgi:hypothetical protein